MIDEIYQCIVKNEYGFIVGQNYRIDRLSEIYLPQSENLEVVDVIVLKKICGFQNMISHEFLKN